MWKAMTITLLATMPMFSAEAADGNGFYWGADLGQAKLDVSRGELDNSFIESFESVGLTVLDGNSDLSNEDFTWGLTFGYQVFRYLAVEAAYVDLGSTEYKANALVTDGVVVVDGRVDIDADTKGFSLSVLGILPVTDMWSVYGRVGAMQAEVDNSVLASIDGLTDTASDSSDGTELLWGVGVGYTLGPWTTRLDFQRVTDVGDEDSLGEADVDRLTLGAIYRFQ